MPTVHHVHAGTAPSDAVYIGRTTKWGNPFKIGVDGDRSWVIKLYRDYLLSNPQLITAVKNELRGKDLICHCSPEACHGDVLLEVANPD